MSTDEQDVSLSRILDLRYAVIVSISVLSTLDVGCLLNLVEDRIAFPLLTRVLFRTFCQVSTMIFNNAVKWRVRAPRYLTKLCNWEWAPVWKIRSALPSIHGWWVTDLDERSVHFQSLHYFRFELKVAQVFYREWWHSVAGHWSILNGWSLLHIACLTVNWINCIPPVASISSWVITTVWALAERNTSLSQLTICCIRNFALLAGRRHRFTISFWFD